MAKNISVGIDIGSATMKVMVLEHIIDKNSRGSKIIGIGTVESRGVRHGYITNIGDATQSLQQALSQAEQSAGIRIRHATVSVGGISLASHIGNGSAIISRADNEVTELDIQKAIKDAESKLSIPNKEIIDTLPLEYKLDGKRLFGRPVGMKGVKLDVTVLFVACLKQHLDDLISVVNGAGVDVLDVIASPLAGSLVTLSEKQRTAGCMLLDIGAETVSIAVFENNTVISLHVFNIGSNDITNDIALGLKIPLTVADEIKQGIIVGDIPQGEVENIIEARLTDIFELVQKYLKKIKRDGLLPAGVIIIGSGAQIPIIEDLSRKILNIPATVPVLSQNKKSPLKDQGWFVSYGLCVASKYASSGNTSLNPFSKALHSISSIFKSIIKQLKP